VLTFTSVYFSESSLFNGLQPIGIKFASTFEFAPRVADSGSKPSCPAARPAVRQVPIAEQHSVDFRFWQDNARITRGLPMSVRWRRRFLNPAAHWRQESRPDVRRRRQFNCINCIDASLAAKLSCPNLPAPAPGTLPCGDVDQSTPRARKSCGCGGGSFNHILHLNKTGRLELAREGHRLRRATCRAAIDHRSRARMGLRRVRGSGRTLTRQLELSRPLQGAFRPKSLANHR
jgi:hypothetical protein